MTTAFDASSGILTTDLGEQIGPALGRQEFLASSLGVDAELLISNEPHASWGIARSLDGRPFRLGLYFEADRLHMVVLAMDEPAYGSSWADWNREREMARKKAHDDWLASFDPAIGERSGDALGHATSTYDEHSAGSQIVLVYAGGPPRPDPPGGQAIDFG